jgi:hypothetical protein
MGLVDLSGLKDKTVGEIGAGPFGGILEVLNVEAKFKLQIDWIMDELRDLNFIEWPDNTFFINNPAECTWLKENCMDVLISYNALDHGWDIKQALRECIRISKECYLSFDCRGQKFNPNDPYHYQEIHFNDIAEFVLRETVGKGYKKSVVWDRKVKEYPVAGIIIQK